MSEEQKKHIVMPLIAGLTAGVVTAYATARRFVIGLGDKIGKTHDVLDKRLLEVDPEARRYHGKFKDSQSTEVLQQESYYHWRAAYDRFSELSNGQKYTVVAATVAAVTLVSYGAYHWVNRTKKEDQTPFVQRQAPVI